MHAARVGDGLAGVRQALASVVVIPVTPFTPDDAVDTDRYMTLIREAIEAGATVITANGNTGEFHALTPGERSTNVEAAVAAADGRAIVVAGVGFDLTTAVEMALFADRAGAGAVMVHQPVHPQQAERGWVEYHRAIAAAVPTLGVVPYIRDPAVTAPMLRAVATDRPNLVGVKYAVPDPVRLAALVADLADLQLAWVCGLAEPWAPFFWTAGARGFTSGLATVAPVLSFRMLDALRRDDGAGALDVWRAVRPFEELRARRHSANNVSAVKEALHQQGRCAAFVRLPLVELDGLEREEVGAILASWRAIR